MTESEWLVELCRRVLGDIDRDPYSCPEAQRERRVRGYHFG